MNVTSPLDDFCTLEEAAEFLRMSRYSVYRLHKKGKLEMVKFMGRTYVSEQSLRDIFKEIKPLVPPEEK
jgi:excisionase family DNA binding protein